MHDVQKLYRKDPKDISTYGDKNISKMPTINYKSPVEYARTAQTRTPSPRSKVYHGFNYFEDRKQRSRKLITPTTKFLKNNHTNNTNDLNPELFENNQDHCMWSADSGLNYSFFSAGWPYDPFSKKNFTTFFYFLNP